MCPTEPLASVTLTPAERDAVRRNATRCEEFSICGGRVRLLTDDALPIGSFCRSFEAFRCTPEPGTPADMTIHGFRTPSSVPTATFLIRDRAYRTVDPTLVADPESILEYLLVTHIRTHYLVHAGCVGRGNRGIVIAGASHMGKTTLTAFLVSRGLQFLSDEIAPISRVDGSVSPFPLALGIRAGPALALVDALPGREFEGGGDRKKLVTSRDFARSTVESPLPLHAIVFVTSRVDAAVSTARRFDGLARVLFAGMNPAFRRAVLERTHSELLVEESLGADLVSLSLQSRTPGAFLDSLRRTAEEHGIPIVFIEHEDLDAKDFNAEPRLLKLPAAAGVLELAKKLPASQKAELVRTQFGGSLPPLIEELSLAVRNVAFYKLSPGRLDAMVQAIETLP